MVNSWSQDGSSASREENDFDQVTDEQFFSWPEVNSFDETFPIGISLIQGELGLTDNRLTLRSNGNSFRGKNRRVFLDLIHENPDVVDVSLNSSPIDTFTPDLWYSIRNIQHLSLVTCHLASLPNEIRSMQHLRSLCLRDNSLIDLPEWIGELTSLESLDLCGNRLQYFPASLSKLERLQSLMFSSNHVMKLPDDFGTLVNLKCLAAYNNHIHELPDSFDSLRALEELDLEKNGLSKLPNNMDGLKKLRKLHLSLNPLSSLPYSVGFSSTLELIDLSYNCIRKLPKWFDDVPSLTRFFCFGNNLTELSPNFLATSHQLQCINLSGNEISVLPETISRLPCLVSVYFGRTNDLSEHALSDKFNHLKALPAGFGVSLNSLVDLKLDFNDISVLPEQFGKDLVRLKRLNLIHNNLSQLPLTFSAMRNLEECLLSHNRLEALPHNFGANFGKMKTLLLDHNKLSGLPLSFGNMVNLTVLDLYKNEFERFPSTVIQREKLKFLGSDLHVTTALVGLGLVLPSDGIVKLHEALLAGSKRWGRSDHVSKINTFNVNKSFSENFLISHGIRKSNYPQKPGLINMALTKNILIDFENPSFEEEEYGDWSNPLPYLDLTDLDNLPSATKRARRVQWQIFNNVAPHMPTINGKLPRRARKTWRPKPPPQYKVRGNKIFALNSVRYQTTFNIKKDRREIRRRKSYRMLSQSEVASLIEYAKQRVEEIRQKEEEGSEATISPHDNDLIRMLIEKIFRIRRDPTQEEVSAS